MLILVTGATGQVGRQVVQGLLAGGAKVRAVSRTPERAGLPAEVEVVEGDLDRPASLDRALQGVDRLYLFPVPDTAAEVADRARRAGVGRIVVLSSSSVLEPGNHSGEHHRRVEDAVRASGVEWTFVRPGEFAANTVWKWGASIRAEGVVRAPYPTASRVLIHEADVGAVAAAALLEEGHAGQCYDLTGPQALTQVEQVYLLSRAIGRTIRFEEQTPEQARRELTQFMPEPVVAMVLEYLAAAVTVPPPVSATVQQVLGRPALSFAAWARAHAGDFSSDAGPQRDE